MDNREWRGLTPQDLEQLTHRPLSPWMQKLIADVETLLKERNHMCDDASKQREAYELGWAIQTGKADWADVLQGQDWSEVEALRASLREHMAEVKRLNDCLTWEQHRAGHIGTHGPGCAYWGPRHYECLLREVEKARKE